MTVKQRLKAHNRKKRYYDANKKKINAYKRAYRVQNRDAVREYDRQYNSNRFKFRMPDGEVRLLTRVQIYKIVNKEKVQKQHHEYYLRIKPVRRIHRQLLKLAGLM